MIGEKSILSEMTFDGNRSINNFFWAIFNIVHVPMKSNSEL